MCEPWFTNRQFIRRRVKRKGSKEAVGPDTNWIAQLDIFAILKAGFISTAPYYCVQNVQKYSVRPVQESRRR